ncbi:MAG: epoxyqueuosine reductase [Oscillospiraceae bacterium]|nr:epoxyqueuosine reductase [Oscillospiraceae bacterium]
MTERELRPAGEYLAETYGAVWGLLGRDDLADCLIRPGAGPYGAALIAAFPYFAGDEPGPVALYARGEDYHAVLHRALNEAAARIPGEEPFAANADVSPLAEVRAAALAGLGAVGRNGLLLTERYGSFVFLGELLFRSELSLPRGEGKRCRGCGACVRACPTGALRGEGPCLSELTQKRHLSPEEEAVVARGGYQWGCDVCQRACPANAGAERTRIPAFCGGTLPLVDRLETAGLSNKQIEKKYARRAFLWRGGAILRRNEALVSGGSASAGDRSPDGDTSRTAPPETEEAERASTERD